MDIGVIGGRAFLSPKKMGGIQATVGSNASVSSEESPQRYTMSPKIELTTNPPGYRYVFGYEATLRFVVNKVPGPVERGVCVAEM